MPDPVPLPITFRPAAALCVLSGATGVVCALACLGVLFSSSRGPGRYPLAIVLSGPAALSFALLRRKIVVNEQGLTALGAVRATVIPWQEVLAVEQTRHSFVIITEQGDVSAGWIDPRQRDLLFRKVLELGRLTLEPREPRWGVIARFVRSQPGVIPKGQIARSRGPEQDRQS